MLHLPHAEGPEINVDAFARWQTELEFVTWLLASKRSAKEILAIIDPRLIERVEKLLEESSESSRRRER